MVLVGMAALTNPAENLWLTTALLSGSLGALSSLSAVGSLALARIAEDRALLKEAEEVAQVGLTGDEVRRMLGESG
jgi:hypothetical protein